MRKMETLDDMRAGLKETEKVFGKSYGMYVMTNFPTESKKERQMTVDFIKEFSPEFVGIYNFTPYPGTKAWNELIPEDEKEEIEKKDYSLLHHAGLKEENSKEVKWMKKEMFEFSN
jgi:tRNA A37 methylthiotransferase MiaB